MDLQLEGRHVLITGGSKGIGLACALVFLQEGARVSLVSRSIVTLKEAAKSLADQIDGAASRVGVFSADLKDATSAREALDDVEKAHGPVDILVNSAGAAKRTPPDELRPQAWHDAMDAKYFTYIHMMDPLVKRMGERGRGVIVNVIGMGGKVATPTHMAGGAANAALMLVTAGLANAYGPKGVRVCAVNPGMTLTERLKEGVAAEARLAQTTSEEALKKASQRLPLGHIATPEEIADAVVFLASPRAAYINGAIISMDGGVVPMVV